MLQGQALGGVFAAATNVFIILLGDEPKDSAFFCFLITITFMLMTGCSLLILTLTKFFRVRCRIKLLINDGEILIQCQIYQTSYVPRLSVPSLQYFVPPFQFYDLSLRPSVNEEEDVLIDDSNEDAGPGPSGNADQGRNSNCVSRAQLKVYDIIC